MALRSACILFPFLSTHVNHCQHTSTNASLWYLGKPWISVTVEIRMKNMDKNRYLQIRSGKYTKTKVADIQWLYSKWLWLITAVYKPSFADALSNASWLSIVYGLKDRNIKNLLVFSQKIEDLTFFFIDSLQTEGEKAKTVFSGPDWPRLQR